MRFRSACILILSFQLKTKKKASLASTSTYCIGILCQLILKISPQYPVTSKSTCYTHLRHQVRVLVRKTSEIPIIVLYLQDTFKVTWPKCEGLENRQAYNNILSFLGLCKKDKAVYMIKKNSVICQKFMPPLILLPNRTSKM